MAKLNFFYRAPALAVRYDRPGKAPDSTIIGFSPDSSISSRFATSSSQRAVSATLQSATSSHSHQRTTPQASPTIIFLHGIAATSNTWIPSLAELSTEPALAHCRLLALDLLGFGHSTHTRRLHYDYNDYATALAHTIKRLRITPPIILVGHSMGALIAANYTLYHPHQVSHLVMVSPPVILPDTIAKIPDKFYLKTYSSLQDLARTPGGKAVAAFANHTTSFKSKYLRSIPFQRSMQNIILNKYNYTNIIHLRTPTTIIHGRFDPLVYKPNLTKLTKHNRRIALTSSMSHHDIDPAKCQKLLRVLIANVKELSQL